MSILLMITACASRTPIPPTVPPRVLPQQVIIVTIKPRPTETPLPTVTPFFNVVQLSGHWLLDVTYQLRGHPFYDNVRYVGSFPVQVAPDGTLSGSGTFYTSIVQPPCSAIVRDGNAQAATLSGKLINQDQTIISDMTLTPQNADATQTFELVCKDTTLNRKETVSLLWPSLSVTGQMHFQIALASNATLTDLRDLNGISGGLLHGTLSTDIRLSR